MVDINEYWEHNTELRNKNGVKRELARVVRINENGEPIIIFMGESMASGKTYPHLTSYIPQIGDRVMLIDGLIIGGWKPNAQ